MPNNVVKAYSKETGKSVKHIERWWKEAEKEASKKFKKKDSHYWAYVNGIVERRGKLKHGKLKKEGLTFKGFMTYLLTEEDKQEENTLLTVHPRKLTEKEHATVVEFQSLCKVLHTYIIRMQKDKFSINDAHDLYNALKQFSNFKFLQRALEELETISVAHDKMSKQKDYMNQHVQKASSSADDIMRMLADGDHDAAHALAKELDDLLAPINHHVDVSAQTKSIVKNFTHETFWLFSGGYDSLIDVVDSSHYEQIINTDLSTKNLTYVNFPYKFMLNDFKYVIAFMLALTDKDEPKHIKQAQEFRKFMMLAKADDDSYQSLKKMVDHYLSSNDRKLIQKIIDELNNHPDIQEANEKFKERITKVYRGVGFSEEDDISEKDVLAYDRNQKYVATSTSRHVAMNFAYQKGHLDAERRSEFGYIITYEVDPSSIVLTTQVLGVAYGESEILIDATKASVEDIESV